MNCTHLGCRGEIEEDGYCNLCGLKAASTMALTSGGRGAAVNAGEATQLTRLGVRTRGSATRRSHGPAHIVEIPTIEPRDPATAVIEDAQVPEEHRSCAACDAPVGRSNTGVPGRISGFCPRCGEPFAFDPKLRAGDVIGGQYEVAGPIARGGMGWIYLARDLHVASRWVVLKGLLNTRDEEARSVALQERAFLAEIAHPDIVKIYNFVDHEDDGYIVMEFVRGRSLNDVLRDWREEHGTHLPVDHALWYILQILPALAYLHELGLIYCDFKPDNVMRTGDSLQLIDLGGAYRANGSSSAIYGTIGYQAPEIAQTGPTVTTDLYTVARTLAVLCARFRYQSEFAETLPPAADHPAFARYDSLYRLLERATAPNPDDRFQSADEMATQLLGVLREVVADSGNPSPGTSNIFTGELNAAADGVDSRALPMLLVAADDPGAGFLATIAAVDPHDVIALLEDTPNQTVEVHLSLARTLIETGQRQDAEDVLASLERENPWEWRVSWYRGLASLHSNDAGSARQEFEYVYRRVPGELAPKLALAFACEVAGEHAAAARYADIVATTDPAFTSAAFCLARCRRALGDRLGAIEAFDRVPQSSRSYTEAQVGKVEALLIGSDSDPTGTVPTVDDLVAAGAIIDDIELSIEERTRLTIRVLEAALNRVLDNSIHPDDAQRFVSTYRLTERELRLGLESLYRLLARRARSKVERIDLVRRANRARPWTLR